VKRPNTSPQSSIRPWTLRSRPCLERQSRLRSTGFVGSLRLGLVLESLVHIAAVPHKELSGMTKYRKGPQRTTKDHKGPQRTAKDPQRTAKDHKGPTNDRKGALRAKLQEIDPT